MAQCAKRAIRPRESEKIRYPSKSRRFINGGRYVGVDSEMQSTGNNICVFDSHTPKVAVHQEPTVWMQIPIEGKRVINMRINQDTIQYWITPMGNHYVGDVTTLQCLKLDNFIYTFSAVSVAKKLEQPWLDAIKTDAQAFVVPMGEHFSIVLNPKTHILFQAQKFCTIKLK